MWNSEEFLASPSPQLPNIIQSLLAFRQARLRDIFHELDGADVCVCVTRISNQQENQLHSTNIQIDVLSMFGKPFELVWESCFLERF